LEPYAECFDHLFRPWSVDDKGSSLTESRLIRPALNLI